MPQQEQLAQYGRRYVEHQGDFEEFLKQKQAQQQAEQAKLQKPKWEVPEFDPEWMNAVKIDENSGRYVAKDWGNPVIADKVNKYLTWKQQAADRLIREPDKLFQELNGDWINERVQNLLDERFAQVTAKQQAEAFIQQNLQTFYELGPDGQPLPDPRNPGQGKLTPYGQAFAHYANQAHGLGLTDPNVIQQYAMAMLERDVLQQYAMAMQERDVLQQQLQGQSEQGSQQGQQAQPDQPQQFAQQQQPADNRPRDQNGRFLPLPTRNEQQKQNFLQRVNGAARQPNRDQTVATAAANEDLPQNANLNFMQLAEIEMRKRGLLQETG